ncbi:alpha-ketoglutarate dehydrogenase component 4 [Petromyzon marinus]|uniref:alpha-ketoglutarate dehydrogenase component 4 n=1 Tax=Petromyzon marinus TaxID=7757 RepID=UPI003F6E5393
MAASARVVQLVKPRIPLIKFRSRNPPKVSNAQELGKTAINLVGTAGSMPVKSLPMETLDPLPPRFRRKALDTIEMEYIQRGGPD